MSPLATPRPRARIALTEEEIQEWASRARAFGARDFEEFPNGQTQDAVEENFELWATVVLLSYAGWSIREIAARVDVAKSALGRAFVGEDTETGLPPLTRKERELDLIWFAQDFDWWPPSIVRAVGGNEGSPSPSVLIELVVGEGTPTDA